VASEMHALKAIESCPSWPSIAAASAELRRQRRAPGGEAAGAQVVSIIPNHSVAGSRTHTNARSKGQSSR
jgi:hypothetical protein